MANPTTVQPRRPPLGEALEVVDCTMCRQGFPDVGSFQDHWRRVHASHETAFGAQD